MEVFLPWSAINDTIKHKVMSRTVTIVNIVQMGMKEASTCIYPSRQWESILANEIQKITHVIYNRRHTQAA